MRMKWMITFFYHRDSGLRAPQKTLEQCKLQIIKEATMLTSVKKKPDFIRKRSKGELLVLSTNPSNPSESRLLRTLAAVMVQKGRPVSIKKTGETRALVVA